MKQFPLLTNIFVSDEIPWYLWEKFKMNNKNQFPEFALRLSLLRLLVLSTTFEWKVNSRLIVISGNDD